MANILFQSLLIFILVSLSLGFFRGTKSYENFQQLKNSAKILNKRVAKLEENTLQLENEILKINQSPNYIKKLLKDKYNEKEAGEVMQEFVD